MICVDLETRVKFDNSMISQVESGESRVRQELWRSQGVLSTLDME